MRRAPRGPQPMAHRLLQRHRPPHLGGEPPRLLAEPGDVLPGEAHHERELGLAVGQRVHRGGHSVVHRLFLTSDPAAPFPAPRAVAESYARPYGGVQRRRGFTAGRPGTSGTWSCPSMT
uniref:Integral membrane protein n=1 Tax=Streptomyces fungicidicus TaxID=68203 RepID=Q06YY1_9ACTN|nr:integral membrane protein [Streptomyces fungicidicus]